MGSTNHITTKWLGGMAFESNNPSGIDLTIDASPEDGGEGKGFRPKALMLSGLAGCSGLDIAMLIKKMKLDVNAFTIETIANLTMNIQNTMITLPSNTIFTEVIWKKKNYNAQLIYP